MATVGNLFINVSANTAQLVTGLAKARAAINSFGVSLINAKVAAFGAAITAAGTALGTYYLKQQAEAIDRTHKLALSLGVATEAMGGLSYAAELSGLSSSQLAIAMQRMMRTIGDAQGGSKTALAALEAIGVSLRDIETLGADKAFALIADRINAIDSPARQVSAAVGIFSRSGAELLPFLRTGSESMSAFAAEARALGKAVSTESGAKVEAANDALTRMRTVLEGVAATVLIEVSPYIAQLGEDITAASKASGGFGQTVRQAIDQVIPVARFAYDVVRSLGVVLEGVRAAWLLGASAWTNAAANMLAAINTVSFGVAGLGGQVAELRAMGDSLGDQAAEGWTAMADKFAALSHSPLDDFKQRADEMRKVLEEQARAANSAGSALGSLTEEDVGLARAQANAIESADKLAHRLFDQARTFGMGAREAEIYLAAVDGASASQIKYLHQVDAWLTAQEAAASRLREIEEEADRLLDANDSVIRSLQEQIDTFGMTASAVEVYRATMRGATNAEIEQIEALGQLLEAKQREADMLREGKQLMLSLRTPHEKFADELERIQQLYDGGAIDAQTFTRAIASATEDLDDAIRRGQKQRPGATSVETVLGEIKVPGLNASVDVQDRMLREAERQSDYLATIAGRGDRSGAIRTLDGAVPDGLARVMDEAVVGELKRANVALEVIAKHTSGLAGVLS